MAQFTLNWDNTAILANANNINQRVSYRQKSVGGAWITAGFTPANDLPTSAVTALSPVLTDNVVYEFIVESLCTQNGPTQNDNGIIEQIGFSCIAPTLEFTDTTATAMVNLVNTDITKVRFVLRKSSDNTIAYGPVTVVRTGNSAQATATGLSPSTNYYWQVILYANINGVEVLSSDANQINSVCGSYLFTTAAQIQDLIWIADDTECEKEGGFDVVKTIAGLSSPITTWYDEPNNRVYVADHDSPNGNVYWFNPTTAVGEPDMTYSAVLQDDELYNGYIDSVHRRIYFVGANTNGLLVYDIDTDTISTVAFGTNAPFARTVLAVTSDKIYCNDANTSIIIIDRTTLAIDATLATGTITNAAHFNTGPYSLHEVNGELWVISFNSNFPSIGRYSPALTSHLGEIVLPGVATWTFGKYWQSGFSDPVSGNFYVHDAGSNKRFVIDGATQAILDTKTNTNRQGKSNSLMTWGLNPITNELLVRYQGVNTSSDGAPIYRVYIEDRATFSYLNMFEGASYINLVHIFGTNNVLGTSSGNTFWSGNPGYGTDGSVTVLSNSVAGNNTGIKITTTLQEVDANNGNTPTGNVKPNIPSDPDYIPPTTDLSVCPLVTSIACPTDLVTTFSGATLNYEFAIVDSVKNNGTIAKIHVYAYNNNTASVEGSPTVINNPNANFYSGTFGGLGGSNYTIQIRYLDADDNILQTC